MLSHQNRPHADPTSAPSHDSPIANPLVSSSADREGADVLTLLVNTPTDSVNGLVDREQLEAWQAALPPNSKITVTCKINFDSNLGHSRRLNFQSTSHISSDTTKLKIDTSTMLFSGTRYDIPPDSGWNSLNYKITKQREARGGVPPYIYTSSNPAIASVDNRGIVTGLREGTATITVKDSAADTASYTVHNSITNYQVLISDSYLYGEDSVNWVRRVGGTTIDQIPNFFNDIYRQYTPTNSRGVWIGVYHSSNFGGTYYFFYPRQSELNYTLGSEYELTTLCVIKTPA